MLCEKTSSHCNNLNSDRLICSCWLLFVLCMLGFFSFTRKQKDNKVCLSSTGFSRKSGVRYFHFFFIRSFQKIRRSCLHRVYKKSKRSAESRQCNDFASKWQKRNNVFGVVQPPYINIGAMCTHSNSSWLECFIYYIMLLWLDYT